MVYINLFRVFGFSIFNFFCYRVKLINKFSEIFLGSVLHLKAKINISSVFSIFMKPLINGGNFYELACQVYARNFIKRKGCKYNPQSLVFFFVIGIAKFFMRFFTLPSVKMLFNISLRQFSECQNRVYSTKIVANFLPAFVLLLRPKKPNANADSKNTEKRLHPSGKPLMRLNPAKHGIKQFGDVCHA